MSDIVLTTEVLCKSFDGIKALVNFSCNVKKGEILGLVGPNGAGKTTLFNIITGFLQADYGSIRYHGGEILRRAPHRIVRLGIARTFQDLRLIEHLTAKENVLLAFPEQQGESLFNVFFRGRACRSQESAHEIKACELLEQVGLKEKAEDLAGNLSYGQQKLLTLACCLATGADLLLLDEPVAGVAPAMIDEILSVIQSLPKQGKTVILIEHDMDAVARVCNRTIFMDEGKKTAEGTPEEIRHNPVVIEAYLD
jgi:ABC-type branched-subunit amino acid transport system ATPase component